MKCFTVKSRILLEDGILLNQSPPTIGGTPIQSVKIKEIRVYHVWQTWGGDLQEGYEGGKGGKDALVHVALGSAIADSGVEKKGENLFRILRRGRISVRPHEWSDGPPWSPFHIEWDGIRLWME